MQFIKIILISFGIVIFHASFAFNHFNKLPMLKKTLIACLMLSVALGTDYFFFDLLPHIKYERDSKLTIGMEDYTIMLSVIIFTLCQLIGIWRIIFDKNDYQGWVIPAMCDLLLKGSIAFLLYGNIRWFVFDTVRALIVLSLVCYDLHTNIQSRTRKLTFNKTILYENTQ